MKKNLLSKYSGLCVIAASIAIVLLITPVLIRICYDSRREEKSFSGKNKDLNAVNDRKPVRIIKYIQKLYYNYCDRRNWSDKMNVPIKVTVVYDPDETWWVL